MFVTLKEYAEIHGLSYKYVKNMVHEKKFKPDFKEKERWYVDVDKPWIHKRNSNLVTLDIPEKDKKRLSNILRCMKQRCYNPNHNAYHRYGGRGILICDEWKNDTRVFILWAMEHGYKDGLEIDRIDNDKNYEPDNCQWITKAENIKKIDRKKIYNECYRLTNLKKIYRELIKDDPSLEGKIKKPMYEWEKQKRN